MRKIWRAAFSSLPTKASHCHSYISGNWWRYPISWVSWPALGGPGVLGMFSRSLPYPHPIHSRQSTNVESTLYSGSIILTVELAAALPSFPTHLNKSDFKDQRPVMTLPAPPVLRCSSLYSGSWATFKASASRTCGLGHARPAEYFTYYLSL